MFVDRADAGRRLAKALADLEGRPDVLVLALPRGGVPVAAPVAQALSADLDVLIVRKLGAPGQEELAIGAICQDIEVIDRGLIARLGVGDRRLDAILRREHAELDRRVARYRHGLPPPRIAGRTVVVVDDGMATGSTMLAACRALREAAPDELIAAVPVASPEAVRKVETVADRVVSLDTPRYFGAVGAFYDDFGQTTDEEVLAILELRRPTNRPPG